MTDVPLSFPAVLRNPKLADRFAHLHVSSGELSQQHTIFKIEPEGKRWVRRRENARFTHNPHIALPTAVDLTLPLQLPLSTFPHPLPPYLPRAVPVPPARPAPSLPHTSTAGLFSLSLRGARRALRARPSTPYLVKAIEAHLLTWLQGGTYLNPDESNVALRFPGDPVGGRDDIREVAREARRLVWAVKADPADQDGGFARYVVHCVARWYGVVSSSKETDGYRLTYLFRPNVTRPDPRVDAAGRMLDTPPATDASDFLASDASLSDFGTTEASDIDVSDVDAAAPGGGTSHALSDIRESRPSSPDESSVIGSGLDAAIDEDEDVDVDERGFAVSMESLSLSTHVELGSEATRPPSRLHDVTQPTGTDENAMPPRARVNRDYLRQLYPRSTSSPSPVRRSTRRLYTPRKLGARRKRKVKNDNKGFAGAAGAHKGTFYDYLFA